MTPDRPAAHPWIAQLYGELRGTLTQVRWLKRACLALLVIDVLAVLGLKIIQSPDRIGF